MSNETKVFKRKIISLDTKIKILDRLKSGEGSTAVANYFNLSEATVRTIKKNEDKIRTYVLAGSSTDYKRVPQMRDSTIESMEHLLLLWIEKNFEHGQPLNHKVIRCEAVKIFNNIKASQLPSPNGKNIVFCGSKKWFENFKKRYYNIKQESDPLNEELVKNQNSVGTVNETISENAQISSGSWMDQSNKNCLTEYSVNSLVEVVMNAASESESESDEKESFKINLIRKGLTMAKKLEKFFIDFDPNTERSLKFSKDLQKCLCGYVKVYNEMIDKGKVKKAFK